MLKALNDAVTAGSVHKVSCLLRAHPLLVSTRMHEGGWTPLLLASYYDQPEVVELILNRAGVGVDDVDQDIFRRTSLHWLAAHGHPLLILKMVKQHGASVDIRDAEQNTPLHRACKANQALTVAMLLMLGADPLARTEEGDLPSDVTESGMTRSCMRLWQTSCLRLSSFKQGRTQKACNDYTTKGIQDASEKKVGENPFNSFVLAETNCREKEQGLFQFRSESLGTRSTESVLSWEDDNAGGSEAPSLEEEDEASNLLSRAQVLSDWGKRETPFWKRGLST